MRVLFVCNISAVHLEGKMKHLYLPPHINTMIGWIARER